MVRVVTTEEVRIIRHKVLRKGRDFSTSFFSGDDLNTTSHLGYFYNNELVSVITLMKNNPPTFIPKKTSSAYQIRGMATLENFQHKGLGSKLLFFLEEYLRSNQCDLIWCNARISAIPFYKKGNYRTIGYPFNITGIGEHYVMLKLL